MKKSFSLLIPSFNSTLEEVVRTLKNVPADTHILIIDDGSTTPFKETFKDQISSFPNLTVFRQEQNLGIERSLRVGMASLAEKFLYVARLDMGDSSPSYRYAKQIEFLSNNPDHVMVGGWGRFVNKMGDELFISKLPVEDDLIRKKMFLNNMFIHPVVMIRTEAVNDRYNYRENYTASEDYDLFFRILEVGKVHNLPDVLIDYEVNFESISSQKRNTQVINRIKIIALNFKFFKYGFYPYYGLLRNMFMLLFGRKTTNAIRHIFKNVVMMKKYSYSQIAGINHDRPII